MTEFIKFVCILIIFFSLLFIATNVEATFFKCITDSDCPKDMCPDPRMKPKCIDARICKCVAKLYPEK
ncbi:unnamed protein product [Trifolium pratense]|uniref:Uncharacterized protein n=1 Tax=Trifolium pratense TaxID=57577 RepID=A0ACB0J3L3_TRIPR|nr:unnamed protein product [Trifolium pratense]